MKKQSLKLGKETGSLVNYIMGNNSSEPKVGEGATVLGWTDRHAYTVTSVSEDNMSCKIRKCKAIRIDSNGISEIQDYTYEEVETNPEIELVYRNGAWRHVNKQIVYTKDWAEKSIYEKKEAGVWGPKSEEIWPVLIEGITKIKKVFSKINIVFGVRNEYYDYSF